MNSLPFRTKGLRFASALSLSTSLVAPSLAFAAGTNDRTTTTPVKHVIVIYGENRSFDHLYATWRPKSGEAVLNLVSQGILNDDGSPGPNFFKAQQFQATNADTFKIAPTKNGPYPTLPPPSVGGPISNSDTAPPFNVIAEASEAIQALLPRYLKLLTTGRTGLNPEFSYRRRVEHGVGNEQARYGENGRADVCGEGWVAHEQHRQSGSVDGMYIDCAMSGSC